MRGTRFHVVATTILGVTLVAVLLVKVGVHEIGRTLSAVDPLFLLFGFLAYAFFFICRGIRWRLLLRSVAPETSVADTASLSAAGWLVSTFVPFKAGDVTRTALLAHRSRTSVFGVAGTVAVERALDLIGIALYSSVSLFVLASFLHNAVPPAVAEAVAFAWALPIAGVLTLLLVARLIKEPEPTQRWKRFVKRFADAADELRRSPRRLPLLAILTAVTSFAQVSMFLFLIHAIAPDLPMQVVAAGVPLFLLSFVVSITPAHVGTYEAAFVAIFALLGLDADTLLPAAFALHILTMSIVTVLGTIGIIQFRMTTPAPPPAPVAAEAAP